MIMFAFPDQSRHHMSGLKSPQVSL